MDIVLQYIIQMVDSGSLIAIPIGMSPKLQKVIAFLENT